MSKVPMIYCDTHQDQLAQRFCRKDQCLICKDCLIEAHIDHSQDCKALINQNILDFIDTQNAVLTSINEKILGLTEDIAAFKNQEKPYKSADFLNFLSTLNKFGKFKQQLEMEVEEQKQNSTEYDFLWKPAEEAAKIQQIPQ